MIAKLCPDDEFIKLFRTNTTTDLARMLGCGVRAIYNRRRRIEGRFHIRLTPPFARDGVDIQTTIFPGRISIDLQNGVVLVISDCHYWVGNPTLMHRAFVSACRAYRPAIVIQNGDVNDFQQISRHLPIGWQNLPTVEQEISAAQERLEEICNAVPRRTRKIWTLGNHDARFSTRLAHVAPEYAKVHGTELSDHFPRWERAWSCVINDDVLIKHRYKGGVYAGRNNTLHAGVSVVTGHLHSANVTRFTDYRTFDRYGVDTGCGADPYGPQFEWMEDNPRDWRSAFCVLHFVGGRLLPPELVERWTDNEVVFRGQIIRV